MNVYCLDCDAEIALNADIALWDEVTCTVCGNVMQVISLDPLELDYGVDTWDDADNWDDQDEPEDESESAA